MEKEMGKPTVVAIIGICVLVLGALMYYSLKGKQVTTAEEAQQQPAVMDTRPAPDAGANQGTATMGGTAPGAAGYGR